MSATTKSKDHYKATAIASMAAGVLSKFLVYPIESIKTMVQVNVKSKLYEPGQIMSLTGRTFSEEGIRGFFRGAGFTCVLIAVMRRLGQHLLSACT
jgi:hypothetical protein